VNPLHADCGALNRPRAFSGAGHRARRYAGRLALPNSILYLPSKIVNSFVGSQGRSFIARCFEV
jgi:hypothetical protein